MILLRWRALSTILWAYHAHMRVTQTMSGVLYMDEGRHVLHVTRDDMDGFTLKYIMGVLKWTS
jgi:hypothetical protein